MYALSKLFSLADVFCAFPFPGRVPSPNWFTLSISVIIIPGVNSVLRPLLVWYDNTSAIFWNVKSFDVELPDDVLSVLIFHVLTKPSSFGELA